MHIPMILTAIPKEIAVTIIAAIPVLELRASIPFGLFTQPHMSIAWTLFYSVLGSWLPAFFILYLLEHIEPILRKHNGLAKLIDKVYEKTRAKSEQIKELEFWGLIIFIGVPLPGTGVWTGVLAAYLLGLSKMKTLIAAFLGTLIAGILVTLVSSGILHFL